MKNKKLFHSAKESDQNFRILSDDELDLVSGGTNSAESEDNSEETPNVQINSSDSAEKEKKLADLASQALASADSTVETTKIPQPLHLSKLDNTSGMGLKEPSALSSESGNQLQERMRSQISALDQANHNIQNGNAMIKAAENNLESTIEVLRTLKEKVINAANDTNTDADRRAIQKEMDQTIAQIDDNALTTFNGKILNDGSHNMNENKGVINSDINLLSPDAPADKNQSVKISMTDMRAKALGLIGSDGNTLDVTSQAAANNAIKVLDSALQKCLDQQATIGAIRNRLDYTSNNLTTASENVQSAEATYSDADMAKEMTTFTKNNILVQTGQSMLAQANQLPQGILSLLQ